MIPTELRQAWDYLFPIRFRHILTPFVVEDIHMTYGDKYRTYYVFGIRILARQM